MAIKCTSSSLPKGIFVRNSVKDAKRTWLAQAIAQLEGRNGKHCSRLARSTSDRRKSEQACNQFGYTGNFSPWRFDIARDNSATAIRSSA